MLNKRRVINSILHTLKRGANTPQDGYDKGKIQSHEKEIQQILSTVHTLSPAPCRDSGVGEHVVSVDSQDAATICGSEDGAYPSTCQYCIEYSSVNLSITYLHLFKLGPNKSP